MHYDYQTLISIYLIIGMIFSILVHMYDDEIRDEYLAQITSIRILLFVWTTTVWLPSLVFRYMFASSFWIGVWNFFCGKESGTQ